MSKDINVIFLDDEESILHSIRRTFINESFGVAVTTSPDEALAIMEKENIKVIFSDHRMPQITGVQFLQKVKELFPDVMRILFTGYAEFSAAEEAINVGGVYRFISKPWETDELKATVHQAIHHFDLVIENRSLFEGARQKNEELEILNRKLKGMYEMQKEFTSTVSHELRTPLASMKSTIDLVLSQTSGSLNENQVKFLTKTKNNVDRLNRLINDILDLTKMESGKIDMKIVFDDIARVVAEVIETHQTVAQEKGLFLTAQLDKGMPMIPFDADKLHQVFDNLVGNALKFTETGGVTISCVNKVEENYVEIAIKDTGPGVKKEDQERLFQKFQQLGDSRKHVGGTGLGLAICKEITHRHGGKIWVESLEGQGSVFKFILPIHERRKEAL